MSTQSNFIQKSFEGLQLWIIPSKEHKFLLTTSEVAKGYGIDESSVRWHKFNHKSELLENTHFISSVGLTNARGNLKVKQVYWTLQGIIRLGFYVDSPRGKKFRDWLEKLTVEKLTKPEDSHAISQSQIISYEYHDLDIRAFQFDNTVYFIGNDAAYGLGLSVINVPVDEYAAWDYMKRFKIENSNVENNHELTACISLEGLVFLVGKIRNSKAKTFGTWLAYHFLNEVESDEKNSCRPLSENKAKAEIQRLNAHFNDIYNMLYLLEHVTKNPRFDNDPLYQNGLKTAYDLFFKEFNSFKNKINNAVN